MKIPSELEQRRVELLKKLYGAEATYIETVKKIESTQKQLESKQKERDRIRKKPKDIDEIAKLPILEAQVQFLEGELEEAEQAFGFSGYGRILGDANDLLTTLFHPALEAAIAKYVKLLEPVEPDSHKARMMVTASDKARAGIGRISALGRAVGMSDVPTQLDLCIRALEEIARRYEKGTLQDVF